MTERTRIEQVLHHLESYLTETLLPFWLERSPDREYGGFLTYFDRSLAVDQRRAANARRIAVLGGVDQAAHDAA